MDNELSLEGMGLDQFYEAYGVDLATRTIGHSEETKRFVFLDTDDYKSVIEAAKNSLDPVGPILVWEEYGDGISDSGRDNYNRRVEGSFAVLYPCENSTIARRQVKRQARTLCLSILAHMLKDSIEGTLDESCIQLQLDNQSGESTGMLISGWSGYGYSFSWLVPLDLRVQVG